MKTNKKLLLLTSMVILFPMLWGLMIWSQLPNQIPIHFNFAGQANNFQSKPLVVFGLPIFDLMVHLFVIFMIGRDSKNSATSAFLKVFTIWYPIYKIAMLLLLVVFVYVFSIFVVFFLHL